MKIHTQFFVILSIILTYGICLTEFFYKNDFNKKAEFVITKQKNDFNKIKHQHAIAMGMNYTVDTAIAYFQKHHFSEMFKACDKTAFTIQHRIRRIRVSKESKNALHAVYNFLNPDYESFPQYIIRCFDNMRYGYEILEQDNEGISMKLQLIGNRCNSDSSFGLITFKVKLNYDLQVIEFTEYTDGKHGLPVFGDGKYPSGLSCSYLYNNNGAHIRVNH